MLSQINRAPIKIGSDVSAIRHATKVTGIQRVIVETHKFLLENLDKSIFDISGFVHNFQESQNFKKNHYLASDPVLNLPLLELEEIDLLLCLDINYFSNIKKFIELKKKLDFRSVYLVYDILPLINPEWFPSIESKNFMRKFIQSIFLLADHIVVNSNKTKRDLLSLGWRCGAEIHVFPLGAYQNEKKFKPASTPRLDLISVGTIEPRKGHGDLLDAFDHLRLFERDCRLDIVGNYGWDSEKIIERIKSHPDYNERLFWHQNLDDDGLDLLFENSRFLVLPSHDEGFGLPLEEALLRKRIVFARDIPVFRERQSKNVKFFSGNGLDLADILLKERDTEWNQKGELKVRSMNDFGADLKRLLETIAANG
jgi:glycosyltransferase involved in cell wall biosynthesis